jgi:glucokinase
LNDFVAVGYGVLNIEGHGNMTIYEPMNIEIDDTSRLVVGIGTGFGSCFLARETKDD